MFIKIPRDPHEFRGFPWNLFQTPNSVQEEIRTRIISPQLPISLRSRDSCLTPTTFVIGQRLVEPLGTSRVPSPKPWSLFQGWAHYDKALG